MNIKGYKRFLLSFNVFMDNFCPCLYFTEVSKKDVFEKKHKLNFIFFWQNYGLPIIYYLTKLFIYFRLFS